MILTRFYHLTRSAAYWPNLVALADKSINATGP